MNNKLDIMGIRQQFNIMLTHLFGIARKRGNQFTNFERIATNRPFKKTSLEQKLFQLPAKSLQENYLLKEVHQILVKEAVKDYNIVCQINTKHGIHENRFDFELLETKNIYHLNQIKEICINYRLRFLDSSYFKGEIPQSALTKIKQIEQSHCIEIRGFKIIAPSKLF